MLREIRAAFSLLTVLPMGATLVPQPGRSFAWFPLVGLVIGGALTAVATWSPLDSDLSAFLVLAFWVLISGGLHLDGFGDCCDGLLASADPARRREIMKDPRAGVLAVAGLVLLLLGKWLAIRAAPPEALWLAPVLGRWAMVWAAQRLPYAGGNGLGARFRPGLGPRQVIIASASVCLLMTQAILLIPWLLVFVFTQIFGGWAGRRLGDGITGDVYGAICELSELICLLALAAMYA